jgi:hypothetical protein
MCATGSKCVQLCSKGGKKSPIMLSPVGKSSPFLKIKMRARMIDNERGGASIQGSFFHLCQNLRSKLAQEVRRGISSIINSLLDFDCGCINSLLDFDCGCIEDASQSTTWVMKSTTAKTEKSALSPIHPRRKRNVLGKYRRNPPKSCNIKTTKKETHESA